MTAIIQSKLTFEQFLERYPDEQGKYELVNGEIVEMRAIRWHDNIADFLIRQFDRETAKQQYWVVLNE